MCCCTNQDNIHRNRLVPLDIISPPRVFRRNASNFVQPASKRQLFEVSVPPGRSASVSPQDVGRKNACCRTSNATPARIA